MSGGGGANAAATALDVLGSIVAGVANSKAAAAQAKVQDMSRDITLKQTALDVYRQRQKNRFNAGANRANLAASGLVFDGSAIDIMNNNAVQDEMDVLLTDFQGKKAAWGYATGAAFSRAESSNAMTAGFLNAGSKLAQGRSSSYLNGNQMPAYNSQTGSNGSYGNTFSNGTTVYWNR